MRKSLIIFFALLAVHTFAQTTGFGFTPAQQSVPGIYLDSHSDKCSQKQITVNGGPITITFDYKVICTQSITQSAVLVLIDGNPIFKVTPRDSGRNIKLDGSLPAGTYTLAFCAQGAPNEPQHQAFISNFIISSKPSGSPSPSQPQTGALGKDLIINGGFEQNKCAYDWCCWDIYWYKPETLPGWTGGYYVEIAKNSVYYRPSIGTGYVALIEAYRKMFMTQKVSLTAGKYSLQFDWASRYLTIYGTYTFEVKYNGKCLKSITLDGNACHNEKLDFTLDEDVSAGELTFSMDGYHCYGVLIDNVKLQKYGG